MRRLSLLRSVITAITITACSGVAGAQGSSGLSAADVQNLSQSIRDLQEQIKELHTAIGELRAEASHYHAENAALQERVQALQQRLSPPAEAAADTSYAGSKPEESANSANASREAQVQPSTSPSIQEQLDLLSGKINDQYQTKVESGSKYRVRVSGIALFNAFANRGSVDNTDFPQLVNLPLPGLAQKSVGGSLRQSILGLETFGPDVAGAKSSAQIQFDFAGGFSGVPNGVNFGIVRLRTATLHLDWTNTSVVVGQDNLFFAPLSPSSLASLAVPALSYSGNLWSWTPQIRVEHRIHLSADSGLSLQAGVLDPLTGESPAPNYYRYPQAGERSGIPAFGTHVGYSKKSMGESFTVGAGSYYSRQDWGFGRTVDSWAGMADVNVPLGHLFSVSGEFYRGRGIGGLGAAQSRSILWSGNLSSPTSTVRGLNDMGAWAQLKFKPLARLEFNVAAGQDSAFRNQVLAFPSQNYYATISSNRSALADVIYHPRSDLIFSAEYDRLRTNSVYDYSSANHISLSMGILF